MEWWHRRNCSVKVLCNVKSYQVTERVMLEKARKIDKMIEEEANWSPIAPRSLAETAI